jgi:hypothetical protein
MCQLAKDLIPLSFSHLPLSSPISLLFYYHSFLALSANLSRRDTEPL